MPVYRSYQNLDLAIEAHAGAYRAQVINSPVGQVAWTPVTLPFSAKALQQARALFGRVRHLHPDGDSEPPLDPKQFGVQLYNSLFGGAIGDCLQRSLERVGSETGLRIRLRLNDAPDLADLPWEYLCAPPPFDFFALSARTPIVRYLATPSAEAPLLANLPLRILVVIANPASAKFPALDVEAEWRKLQTALADLVRRQLVVLERLETASLAALSARLRISAEKEPTHLLHFIGHGGMGVLAFVDETGQPQEVAAEKLGKILRDHRPLRLVFLNACEGGRSEARDIFTGVAPQLVQQEVPAVIAMKYAVTDRAAIDLATRFYEAIADGYPVDAALAEARRGLYTTSASVEWGTPLLFMRATDSALIDPLDLATIPACPYPGMVPFSAKDARFFFGRTEEIAAMRRHLRNQQQLFVIGPSGSGKSSLVFAGLLPALADKEPGKWQVQVLRPGATPHSRLQEAVGDLITLAPTIARQPASDDVQQLLLVVDQFEELFVQNAKSDQNAFIAQLKAIRQLARVALVVTMRADFYPDLMNSDFWPIDASQRMEIAPLRGETLRAAIEEPAKLVKVTLESGLVERLLADAADEPGVLPLLQETMILLWGEQKRRVLPLAAYHALGAQGRSGLAVAMATKADATLANLSPQQQTIARRIFLRLVQFGEGRSDTRRQQRVGDLHQVDADGNLVDETLTTLVDNRLLTLSGEASDPERKVDIAHEMLIVGWPTSQSWVQSRREAELTRRRLEEKAKEWVRLGTSSGGLLDEAELGEAERWMASADASDLGYSADLKGLAEKSRKQIQDDEAERESIRQRELIQAQQLAEEQRKLAGEQRLRADEQTKAASQLRSRAWWLAIASGLAMFLAIASGWFGVDANNQREVALTAEAQATIAQGQAEISASEAISEAMRADNEAGNARQAEADAQKQARVARAGELAVQSQSVINRFPQRALLLAIEAVSATRGANDLPTLSSLQSLYETLTHVGGRILHNDSSKEAVIAFSPNGHWLAVRSSQNLLQLFDLAVHDLYVEPIVLDSHGETIITLTFSSSNRWLVTGSVNGIIQLWDLKEENKPIEPISLNGHVEEITTIVISPDNHWLVTGSSDHTARLWDLMQTDPSAKSIQLTGHDASISNAIVSPDSGWLVTLQREVSSEQSSKSNFALLWNLKSSDPSMHPIVLSNPNGNIAAIAISPNSQWLVTTIKGGPANLWNLTSEGLSEKPITLTGHELGVGVIAFSPDSRWLATARGGIDIRPGQEDNTARLWNLTAKDPSAQPIILSGHFGDIWALAFSPDSRWFVTGGGYSPAHDEWDGIIRMWDLTAQDPSSHPIILSDHEGAVSAMSITPDGHWLVSGGTDTVIRLWDMTNNNPAARPIRLVGHEGWMIENIIISPDSRWLVTKDNERNVRLWSLITGNYGTQPYVLSGHEGAIWATAFSSDSHWLATGGANSPTTGKLDTAVRVWNLSNKNPSAHPIVLPGHEGGVWDLAISPANRWLLTGNGNGAANLWDLTAKAPSTHSIPLSGNTGSIWSVAISPNNRWIATGGGIVRLWDWSVQNPATKPPVLSIPGTTFAEVAFSADSHFFASTNQGDESSLWDLTKPDSPSQVLKISDSPGRARPPIIITSDNHWLVTAGMNNTHLWDLSTLEHPTIQSIALDQGNLTSMAVSPDSHWLVTANYTARLWNLRAKDPSKQSIPLPGHNGAIWVATISPDSHWLVTGSWDHTIRLWDLEAKNPAADPIVLTFHTDGISSVNISPDGRWLAAGSGDHKVSLWNLKVDDLIKLACSTAGRNLSPTEWNQYFPEQKYRLTCIDQRLHPAFLTDAAALAQRGEITQAVAEYQEALRLDPMLVITPEVEANLQYAPVMVDLAAKLASSGEITASLASISRALQLDPAVVIKANTWNEICWYGAFAGLATSVLDACDKGVNAPEGDIVHNARGLARAFTGDMQGAIEDFEAFVKWTKETGQGEANRNYAIEFVNQAAELVRSGAITVSLAVISQALQLDPAVVIDAETWNSICWDGALNGLATDVLNACDKAVASAPEDGGIRDSRGLVRALTGDRVGAIEDFAFAVQWVKENGYQGEFITSRQRYVGELKAGRNPFTPEELDRLRNE